eukprot:5116758-Prymnesium_polylepis.1
MGCTTSKADEPTAPQGGQQQQALVAGSVTFEAATPDFSELHDGFAALLAEAEEDLFHEAGVWIPSSAEWLVTSDTLLPGTPETHVTISAIHHESGV